MRKRLIAPLIILLIAAAFLWQRQNIHDLYLLNGYSPAPSVVQLADQTTLTSSARRVFYVNHPAVQDRESFQNSCSNHDEQTIVLGCYHPVDKGIYVFHVSDDRLSGVDQVTAAHELLHAEYDRLSSKERTHINGLLEDFYKQKVTDPRLKAVFAAYQKTEPNDIPNEMHSIFGTEIVQLTPELETYYQRYFTDRSKVTAYASAYQAEFTSRQNQVTGYDQQLNGLQKRIDDDNQQLRDQIGQITSQRDKLESQQNSGDIDGYNAGVPAYNARITAYNQLVVDTRQLVSDYNKLVTLRNDLALQVTELANAINSNPQTIQN